MARVPKKRTMRRLAAVLAASLSLSSSASADSSSPGAAPAASAASQDDGCVDQVTTWTTAASRSVGLEITPVSCPGGLVRLKVQGAGCDFEVSREGGFKRTADGKFGVSPIVDLDWDAAPEPMKKGLASVLTALANDPGLPLAAGNAPRRVQPPQRLPGSRRAQLAVGGGSVAVFLAALAIWWRRRTGARRPLAPAPPPAEPPA